MISNRVKLQLEEDGSRFMGHIRPKDASKGNEDIIDVGVGNIRHITKLSDALLCYKDEIIKETIKLSSTYPGTQGYMPLNEKISELIFKEKKIRYSPEQIVITNGVFDGITKALFCYNDVGDNIFYYVPCFPYKASADRNLVRSVEKISVNPEYIKDNFGNDYETASKNNKIKSVIVNIPNNPTGATISKEQLKKTNEVAANNDATVILDDVYSTFSNDKGWCGKNFDTQRTVVLDGFSKKFGFPGLRIGYMVVPKEHTKYIAASIGNQYIGVSMASVAFADKALEIFFQEKLLNVVPKEIGKRQRNLDKGLKNLKDTGVNSPKPAAGMYRLLLIDEFYKKTGYDDLKLVNAFKAAGVKTTPGSLLYPVHLDKNKLPKFVRISVGGDSRTKEAAERIIGVLEGITDKNKKF